MRSESEKTSLYELWERRKIELDQSLELQLFYRDCQNADNQMAKQENILSDDNVGDSLDAVDVLIGKYDDFANHLLPKRTK